MNNARLRKSITFISSVVLSIGLAATVVYATTFLTTSSVGVATDTPGAALSVKGQGLFEGSVFGDSFTSTSTTATSWLLGYFGIGTTTPSATLARGGFSAEGSAIIGNFLYTSFITATSTTATSTFKGGLTLSQTNGNVGIGATTTPVGLLSVAGTAFFASNIGVSGTATSTYEGGVQVKSAGGLSSASGLTITGGDILSSGQVKVTSTGTSTFSGGSTLGGTSLVADYSSNSLGIGTSTFPTALSNATAGVNKVAVSIGAGSASTTLFIAGGAGVGSSIILQSTDGSACIAIMATRAGAAIDAVVTLTAKVVGCPRP